MAGLRHLEQAYSNVYSEVLQEIQLLLGWLNIRATINAKWNSTYEKYYYDVYVKSSWHVFHDKVDFISSEKKKLDVLCGEE